MSQERSSNLLSIGRFGKLANLSARQLRYYHELGLLVPAAIDQDSGYRYYLLAQRATAELIALLRSVDMPLTDIQQLLEDRSPVNVKAVFARLRERTEERLQEAREILSRLDQLDTEHGLVANQAPYAFEAFSAEADELLKLAQTVAEDHGDRYVGTEHMLAALATVGGGAAGRALNSLGVDAENVMATAQELPAEEGVQGAPDQLIPTTALRSLIAEAFGEAGIGPPGNTEAEKRVESSHLLIASYRAADDAHRPARAPAILALLGADEPRVRAALAPS